MKKILVIADDFTGAAEIAGVGLRFGLSAVIVRAGTQLPETGLLIIDTDSRSLPPAEAGKEVGHILAQIAPATFDLTFKKIDSALRGPLMAELEAALAALGRRAALVMPANPARGRTIVAGQYLIDGFPLNETNFANDPEYPARTADVLKTLGISEQFRTRFVDVPEEILAGNIVIGAAASWDDLARWASVVRSNTLAVGAAEFFAALLQRMVPAVPPRQQHHRIPGNRLIVSGSTASSSAELEGIARFELTEPIEHIADALRLHQRAIIGIFQPGLVDRAQAHRLTQSLAQAVAQLLSMPDVVQELIVEGGATASAIIEKMGWRRFIASAELAPGIVRLQVPDSKLYFTLKPGSYPWPAGFWNPPAR